MNTNAWLQLSALIVTCAAAGVCVASDPQATIANARETRSQNPAAAAKILQDAVDTFTIETREIPNDAEAWYGLACVTFELGRDDQGALKAIATAIRLSPREPRYHVQQGLMLLQHGDHQAAEQAYRRAAEIAPTSAVVQLELSQVLYSLGKLEAAAAAAHTALKIDPKNVSALMRLAILSIDLKKEDDAIQFLRQARDANPQDESSRSGIGQLLQELGKFDEAYAIYAALDKEVPNDLRYESRLLQLCQSLNRIEERDRRLKSIYELHRAGKAKRTWFCREQFNLGDFDVMAVEYFELDGKFGTKLNFVVTPKHRPDKEVCRIALQSPEFTTEAARATGALKEKDDRAYSIDVYRDGSQELAGLTLGKQPTYESVRTKVVEILKKNPRVPDRDPPEKPRQ